MEINKALTDRLSSALKELEIKLEGAAAFGSRLDVLGDAVHAIPQALNDTLEGVEGLVRDGAFTSMDQMLADSANDVEEMLEGAAGTLEDEIADTIAQGIATVNELLDEDLPSAGEAIASEFTDVLDSVKDETEETINELAGELMHKVGSIGEGLVSHAADRVVAAMGDAAETVLETAVRDTTEALVKMIATAQISVALQPVIAPVTPQLIVLKPAVPAIKAALEALP